MADLVTVDDPKRMSLLGLILASIIQRNLEHEENRRRIGRLSGAVAVTAGEMKVTLRFAEGRLTVTRAEDEKPRAAVSGTMDSLMGVALGRGMVGPWLAGKLKVSGNLLLLLRMLPLMSAD